MNNKDINNLIYRADKRTIKQFKEDLSRDTKYEKIAAIILKIHFESAGKKVEIKDFGMDNSGNLVLNSKNVNANPDYLFNIDGTNHFYEIKVHSDKYPCMTFKKSNIDTYLKKNAECVIITESVFYIFGEKAMQYLINDCEAKSYPGFASGKLAYRLNLPEISVLIAFKLVEKNLWNKEALKYIEENKEIFNR